MPKSSITQQAANTAVSDPLDSTHLSESPEAEQSSSLELFQHCLSNELASKEHPVLKASRGSKIENGNAWNTKSLSLQSLEYEDEDESDSDSDSDLDRGSSSSSSSSNNFGHNKDDNLTSGDWDAIQPEDIPPSPSPNNRYQQWKRTVAEPLTT